MTEPVEPAAKALDPYSAARVKRQAKWFALSKIGIAAIALLTQFVLVRHLSITDYAGYTAFMSTISVLVFITMYGLDRVAYRFMPPLRSEHKWREMLHFMARMFALRLATILLLIGLLWFALRSFMPQQLLAQLQVVPLSCLIYALALGCTDTFPVFCNALGQQGKQSLLLMATTCLRMLLIVAFLWLGPMTLVQVASMMAATECLLAALLFGLLAQEILNLRRQYPAAPGSRLQLGFAWGTVLRDAISTQLAYTMALPFRGIFLRLIVASIAPPVVIASFGFFQSMADRAYQFMPMFLMKGMLEPTLASDYAKTRDVERIRLTVSLLLRTNAVILAAGFAILLGCGPQVIDLATNGRYGTEVVLALWIVVQFVAITIAETLWISLNPIGRIAFHNTLWTWFSFVGYGLLGIAVYRHDPILLVAMSAVPYLAVYLWLRYISREASLQGGFAVPRLLRLLAPIAAGALAAQGVLHSGLPAGLLQTLLALLAAGGVFAVVLRFIGLFQRAEIDAVQAISPKLAKLLRLMSS